MKALAFTPMVIALLTLGCGKDDDPETQAAPTTPATEGGAGGAEAGGSPAAEGGQAGATGSGGTAGGGADAQGGAGGEAGRTVTPGGPEVGARVCEQNARAVPIDDVSGKWAYLEVQAQIVQAPAIADPFQNTVVTAALLDQTQDGEAVTGTGTVCHRHTSGGIIAVEIPDRLVESIEPFEYTATYGADGSYAMDPVYMLLGYTADDPADGAAIPTSASDDRVYDQDGDGNPGITVVLSGLVDGLIYTVQWSGLTPVGATVAEDRIEGLLNYEIEESVIGSDPALLTALATDATPAEEPCWSTFQMVRVPDDADCAWLEDELVTLFPDVESTLP